MIVADILQCAAYLALIFILVWSLKRERKTTYTLTIEYHFFQMPYGSEKGMERLNQMGAEGWDVAACIGETSYYTYLLLKREKLHKSTKR